MPDTGETEANHFVVIRLKVKGVNTDKPFCCDLSKYIQIAFWTHSIRAFLDDPPWGEGVWPEATEKAAG